MRRQRLACPADLLCVESRSNGRCSSNNWKMPMRRKPAAKRALDCVYSFADDSNRSSPWKKDYCKTNASCSKSRSIDDTDKEIWVSDWKFYGSSDQEDASCRSEIELCCPDESTGNEQIELVNDRGGDELD